ncbi:diaminopimelate epimerase [Methylosinus sp. sav-2]|uniref:diaminopimelate epimerase n=1 Tax=Methylosinus sp. sav-2 TaxID=2485168 RepID=UPI00047CCA29|nr:diaminopimelate epimerase [Methylosinus sp. sav-2]
MTSPLAGLPIFRMNGIGNEILVLDLRSAGLEVAPAEARAIAHAPGLRFDQLMVLHAPRHADANAYMRIYNTDGSLSAACGNGTRCVAYVLGRAGEGEALTLETDAGPVRTWRAGETRFTVDMGAPRLGWRDIPLAAEAPDTRNVPLAPEVQGAPAAFSAVNMGNPHAVFFVADPLSMDLATLGPQLEHHKLFPERANISFAKIIAPDEILLRVWERGTGETRACGSAACATLVAAARAGLSAREARIRLPGGELVIAWGTDDHVMMTGDVELEFETALEAGYFAELDA